MHSVKAMVYASSVIYSYQTHTDVKRSLTPNPTHAVTQRCNDTLPLYNRD